MDQGVQEKVFLHPSDGLESLPAQEVDSVIIAGMAEIWS
jgi:hypothetical protein